MRHGDGGAEEVIVGSTYFMVVAGRVPSGLSHAVQDQFDDVRVAPGQSHTVIECSVSDQSALRVLLTQLWDVGSEVLLVSQVSNESPRSRHGHDHH